MPADEGFGPADPGYWNGTLLKCPACRLKFPFSAADQPFELRPSRVTRNSTGSSFVAPTTRCPQCDGWVTIT